MEILKVSVFFQDRMIQRLDKYLPTISTNPNIQTLETARKFKSYKRHNIKTPLVLEQ